MNKVQNVFAAIITIVGLTRHSLTALAEIPDPYEKMLMFPTIKNVFQFFYMNLMIYRWWVHHVFYEFTDLSCTFISRLIWPVIWNFIISFLRCAFLSFLVCLGCVRIVRSFFVLFTFGKLLGSMHKKNEATKNKKQKKEHMRTMKWNDWQRWTFYRLMNSNGDCYTFCLNYCLLFFYLLNK